MRILSLKEIQERTSETIIEVQCGLTSGRWFSATELSRYNAQNLRYLPESGEVRVFCEYSSELHEAIEQQDSLDRPLTIFSPFLDEEMDSLNEDDIEAAVQSGEVYFDFGPQFHYVSHGEPIKIQKRYFKDKDEIIDLCLLDEYSGPFRLYVQFAGETIDLIEMEKPEGDYFFQFDMSEYSVYRKERLDLEACVPQLGGSYVRFFID